MMSDQKPLFMKKLFWILITYTLTIVACTKSNATLSEDSGCIERILIPVTAHSINSVEIPTVNNLFINNGIDNSKFRYYKYIHDTLLTLYSPYAKYDQKTVRFDQYTNGVKLFTGDLVYNFLSNSFNSKGGNITNGTSLNTSAQLTLGRLRKLFVDDIELFDHNGKQYKDSCFNAEFGYYNLNAGTGNTSENLVKAWHLTPKFNSYPEAYYQDIAGKIIYYFNGIETFK